MFFSAADRERVRARVLAWAAAEPRVTAGAVVGSLAVSDGDRWSDLDLTFAVAEPTPLRVILTDWTARLTAEFAAVQLFDLPSGPSLYRVFLLPGCLQFDLSFTPAAEFGATGPKFKLLFGQTGDRAYTPPPAAAELLGHAVHHLVRARFCIERGRFWQAEYWISGARDESLQLACLQRGRPARPGRGLDDLPAEVRAAWAGTLVQSLEPAELRRTLAGVCAGLEREAGPLADPVAPYLRQLAAD